MSEVPEDVERWTAGRRLALVTEILAGKLSVEEAARQHGPTVADVEEWKERVFCRSRIVTAPPPWYQHGRELHRHVQEVTSIVHD